VNQATQPPTLARGATSGKRRRWGWIVAAAAVTAGVGMAAWYHHVKGVHAAVGKSEPSRESNPGGDAGVNEPVPVETARLTQGGITRTSTQIGSVQPFEEADLYAKISGYLSVLKVDYGDHVKREQLLAEVDDPEVVKDAEKAAADVEQAKAAVAQAEAFVETAKADRDASASAVEQAIAEVERYVSMTSYHGKKFARYKELVQSRAIPQNIADEEEESYESARASEVASRKAVLNAKAQLVAAGARVKKAEADLAEAKANVRVAEAKLAKANVLVGYTKIRSPYDGVITKRNFYRGAFVRSAAEGGTIPLLTVARTDKVRVVTEVPDRDVPLTDVGDAVEVTLDALGTEVLKGKVSRFAETEDLTSRTMHTEIDLPNTENRIRPGMYGIAKIILDTSTKNSTLPASCLVGESKGGQADVYVIKDGKAKKTKVTVGDDDGIRVEILSGLTPQDEVIVSTGSVTEGTPVRSVRQVAAAGEPRRD
jgi:HlyD family secretion protein